MTYILFNYYTALIFVLLLKFVMMYTVTKYQYEQSKNNELFYQKL